MQHVRPINAIVVVLVLRFLTVVFVVRIGVVGGAQETDGFHQGSVIDFEVVGETVLAWSDGALVNVTQVEIVVIVVALGAATVKGEFCDAQVRDFYIWIVGLDVSCVEDVKLSHVDDVAGIGWLIALVELVDHMEKYVVWDVFVKSEGLVERSRYVA